MNEVVKQEPKLNNLTPAAQQANFFEEYGSSVSNRNIIGQLLKFSKGDWLVGQDAEELPAGKTLVALMDTLSIGWIRWADNKPDQQRMGLVMEGYRPARRSELGDEDQSTWEIDSQGKPRDPWQFSNYVLMKEPGKDREDDANLYTFATSSTGGLNAIGELSKIFGKSMREKPDEYPVIELGVDSYMHPNKEFGRIKTPVLKVVGWEPKSGAPQQVEAKQAAKKPAAKTARK